MEGRENKNIVENLSKTTEQVQQVLKYTYGLVPIVAGFDKFTNLLTNWKDYHESLISMFPFTAATFISIVGIIEIAAGLLVLFRPKIGSWVVMAWLILIAFTLIFSGRYFDVAVRDLVMAVGAFSLAKLSNSLTIRKPVF
jgi:hypothetical protein